MKYTAKIITHRGEKRVAVFFDRDDGLIAAIKAIDGSKWSQTMKVWHLPDHDENRKCLGYR